MEATDGDAPRLRLDRLPTRPRESAFVRFVRDARHVAATDVLHAVATRLDSESEVATDLLSAFLSGRAIDAIAQSLDCAAAPLGFFPRAFVQPIAQAFAEQVSGDRIVGEGTAQTSCPHCGSPPLAAVLRDEPEIRGRRSLLCSLCSTEWSFPRTRCPNCAEERPDELQYHVTERWPHVRIEACRSCHTYVKAVDLRSDGIAVPVVDELAAVELDLWAGEQGLQKLQKNLLGL